MLPSISFNDFESYSDSDLQIFANLINAFLYADSLKSDGIIEGGPEIDRNAMLQLLVYCDDRGIVPAKEKSEIWKYLNAINESL